EEALATATRNRPELPQAEGNILNQQIAGRFAKNLLKPTLTVFGRYTSSGLYGDVIIPGVGGAQPVVIPGGFSQALSQVFHSKFPEFAIGFSLSIPILNRSAQADDLRARLEERQAETSLQRTRNQIGLEVRNAVIALMQAKA